MKKLYNLNFYRKFTMTLVLTALTFVANSQLTGTKSIPADYLSVSAFVTDLNTNGVGIGGVILNVPAGYTETLTAQLTVTATGTSANPITIQKSGVGVNPILTSYVGANTPTSASRDGMLALSGTDYMTIDGINFQESASNTTELTCMEYAIGLFKVDATDGAQNNTIKNCTITLNRIGNTAWTGTGHNGSIGIVVLNCTNAANAALTPTVASGSNSNNKIQSNTIQNVNAGIAMVGYVAPSPFTLGDNTNEIGGTSAVLGNSILNFGGAAAAANPSTGIFASNQWGLNCSYNTINNNNGSGVNHVNTLRGIFLNASSTSASVNCNNNNVSVYGGGTTSQLSGIENSFGSTAAGNTINLNNNTVTGAYLTATTGLFYGIYSTSSAATVNILNNSVSNFTYSSSTLTGTGSNYYIYSTGAGTNINLRNNIVNNNTRTGTSGGTTYGLYTSSGTNQTLKNNTLSNITISGTGTGGAIYGMYTTSGTIVIDSNTMFNLNNTKTTGTGLIYGIYDLSAPTNENYNYNTIYNFTHTGTGTIYGIYLSTTTGVRNISFNKIYNLTTGGNTIAAINSSSSSPSIFNNKIYGITANGTAPFVYGISIGSVGTSGVANIYNNYVGDLFAPNANTASVTAPSIRGIFTGVTTATSSVNIRFNTVHINATSIGASFTTAALFQTGSTLATSGTLSMNNNIFSNTSTPNGTGFAYAYGRSLPTATNLSNTSNRNDFYVGTPSASKLIYYDGTNSAQTIAAYQGFSGGADAASISVIPNFLSTTGSALNYLHIDAAITTILESSGTNFAGITKDFDGDIRAGNAGYAGTGSGPDIGADEFEGISPAPILILSMVTPSLAPQCVTASARAIDVNVTTSAGTITTVMLNYSFNGVAQPAITMTNSSGSLWTGTIPVATPTNATVTWNISATNTGALTSVYTGASYSDLPLQGISATASSTLASVCSGSQTSVSAVLGSSNPPANYAIPSVSFPTSDEDFGTVTITQGATTILSNTSVINTLNGTIGVATGTAGSYSNFTAFGPYAMTAGQSYNFSLSSLTTGTAYGNSMAIFIDYNRNGVFTDAGEMAYGASATISGAHTETGTFVIPASALNGLTRMRVISNEGTFASYPASISYGEYEDYMLNISSANAGGGAVPAITSITWSDGSTTVGTGSPLNVMPTATTTYTATIVALGCPITANTSITALPLPAAPIATNSSHCGLQVPTASIASGAGVSGTNMYNWYTNAAGTTLAQPATFGPLSTYYTNDFSSAVLTNSSIIGNASVTGNTLQLFPNALSQNGALTVNASGQNSNKYAFDFKLITSGASVSNMADGLSFSFGDDASAAVSGTMNSENGTGTKLKVGFVAYSSGGSNQGIYLMYNSTTNEQLPTSPGVLAYNNSNLTWLNDTTLVAMTIDSTGKFNMTLDGAPLFTDIQLPAAFLNANKANWAYVLKGRSGGIAMGATIDDLVIKTSQVIPGNTTLINPVSTTTTYYANEIGTNGCISPLTPVVVSATLPASIATTTSTNVFCLGDAYTVSSSSSASPAYTYTWTASPSTGSGIATSLSGASQTITPTAGGTYSYYVSGENGICTEVDTFVVTVNSLFPTAPAANPTVFDACAGATTLPISVTTPPSSGAATIVIGTNVSSTGTGAATVSATITGVPVGATITSATLNLTNVEAINGSYRSEIRVATTGAYTLAQTQISTLGSSGIITPNPSITLTGFNAATGTINVLLTETYDDGGATTIDATFGSISLVINYTVPPVSISWFGTATGGTTLGSGVTLESIGTPVIASPASNGSYSYYAQAQIAVPGGCISPSRTLITVNVASVNAVLTPVHATCNGTSNGSFTLGTVACGTAPFTYSVNGGAFGAIPTNLAAGTYTVVIKDALNNNSSSKSIIITQPVWTVNNAVSTNGSACVGDLSEILSASATISTGGAASIQWYTALTGGTLLGSAATLETVGTSVLASTATAGTYNFYAQATNAGCLSPARTLVTVTVNALPVVGAGSDVLICSDVTTNPLTLSGSGATTYAWDNGVTDGVSFNVAATTTYTVTGTDANGCQNTDQVLVTLSTIPTAIAGSDISVCSGNTVTLTGTTNGSSSSWNNGVTNGVAFTPTVLGATSYVLTTVNAAGCQNTDTLVVTLNASPTVNAGTNVAVCTGTTVVLTGTSNGVMTWNNGVANGVGFPATTGVTTYILTATNAANCVKTDTVLVTGNALPIVNAGFNSVTICEGSVITLNATGPNLVWNNGVVNGVAFVPTVQGYYTVTGTNANGCSAMDSLSITINALPGSVATAVNATTINATPAGASTYQWINCATNSQISGANSATFTATIDGTYAVIVTNANGCSDTSNCVILNAVGVKELMGTIDAQLYPNPTTGLLYLNLTVIEAVDATIMDAQGKVVGSINGLVNGAMIDLSGFERGLYLVQLSSTTGKVVQRIMKN